jgi:HK97 family phage major capsid protein
MSMTTANTGNLRRSNLWSSQLKDVLEDELSAQAYVRWLTEFPDGDTFNIPSIGDLPVRDYVEDTPVVYDAMDTGNFTFTIGEYVSSGTYITKKAMQDGYYMNELVSTFVPKQARAIMEKLETDILALGAGGASGGQTANATNAINGAEHRFIGTGTDETMAVKDFAKVLFALKKANVPDVNLIALVDPSVEYTLNTLRNIVNVSNNPMWEGIITSGLASGRRFVKNIFGFDVYTSNYLPKDQNETITLTTGDGVANIFFSAAGGDMMPFVGAWRQMPEVDSEYNKDFQREEYVTTCRYGLKVYRPENLVVVLTDTDQV